MIRPQLLVLSALLVACGGAQATGEPASSSARPSNTAVVESGPCLGTWAGSAVQEGAPWTLELTVGALGPGECGTIEYPSLGCGGIVLDCTALPDGRVTMRELYTHNPGTCADAGQIYAMCGSQGGGPPTMLWTWEGDGGPVTTTLVRQ